MLNNIDEAFNKRVMTTKTTEEQWDRTVEKINLLNSYKDALAYANELLQTTKNNLTAFRDDFAGTGTSTTDAYKELEANLFEIEDYFCMQDATTVIRIDEVDLDAIRNWWLNKIVEERRDREHNGMRLAPITVPEVTIKFIVDRNNYTPVTEVTIK